VGRERSFDPTRVCAKVINVLLLNVGNGLLVRCVQFRRGALLYSDKFETSLAHDPSNLGNSQRPKFLTLTHNRHIGGRDLVTPVGGYVYELLAEQCN
jgi:hypothetical protein